MSEDFELKPRHFAVLHKVAEGEELNGLEERATTRLLDNGYLVYDDAVELHLTDKGWGVLKPSEGKPQSQPTALVETSGDVVERVAVPDEGFRVVVGFGVRSHPDTCHDCIYKQAIDIMAAKLPEVRQLLEGLRAVESLAKQGN